MTNEQLKIGGHVWMFDENERVYDKADRSGPIYEKHFIRCRIANETTRSWIVTRYEDVEYERSPHMFHKVSKKDLSASKWNGMRQRFFTDEMKADHLWMHDHKWRIVREIEGCRDVFVLQKVAQAIGYDSVTKTVR